MLPLTHVQILKFFPSWLFQELTVRYGQHNKTWRRCLSHAHQIMPLPVVCHTLLTPMFSLSNTPELFSSHSPMTGSIIVSPHAIAARSQMVSRTLSWHCTTSPPFLQSSAWDTVNRAPHPSHFGGSSCNGFIHIIYSQSILKLTWQKIKIVLSWWRHG